MRGGVLSDQQRQARHYTITYSLKTHTHTHTLYYTQQCLSTARLSPIHYEKTVALFILHHSAVYRKGVSRFSDTQSPAEPPSLCSLALHTGRPSLHLSFSPSLILSSHSLIRSFSPSLILSFSHYLIISSSLSPSISLSLHHSFPPSLFLSISFSPSLFLSLPLCFTPSLPPSWYRVKNTGKKKYFHKKNKSRFQRKQEGASTRR